MSDISDRHKIEVLLRAFYNKNYSFEDSIQYILDVYKDSKRFSFTNFMAGFVCGGVVALLILNFIVL